MRRIFLITVVALLSSCTAERPSVSEEVLRRANEVLVSQPVNERFLEMVGLCPNYENNGYRQITDARADAVADIGERHFRMVLTSGSDEMFLEQYVDQTVACVGELPPFSTIWILSPAEKCGLVEDMSIRARSYGMTYSSVMMDKLIEERGCD